jgi:hypothetical protein
MCWRPAVTAQHCGLTISQDSVWVFVKLPGHRVPLPSINMNVLTLS